MMILTIQIRYEVYGYEEWFSNDEPVFLAMEDRIAIATQTKEMLREKLEEKQERHVTVDIQTISLTQ